jgi:uncharacterized protein involved in tellurium resistance
MDPLYDALDTEVIERVCGGSDDRTAEISVYSFHTTGLNVFVRSDGVIRVCRPDEGAAREPVFSRAVEE